MRQCARCAGTADYDSVCGPSPRRRPTGTRPDIRGRAFLKAFNSALDEYKDESRAFAVAHSAAQRAPRNEPDEDKDR